MYKNRFAVILAIFLALVFVTPSIAQDAKKSETKKMEKKEMKEAGTLKEVACDPACGFRIQSHDEKEIVSAVKMHAKTHHKMDLTDAQVKEKFKEVK